MPGSTPRHGTCLLPSAQGTKTWEEFSADLVRTNLTQNWWLAFHKALWSQLLLEDTSRDSTFGDPPGGSPATILSLIHRNSGPIFHIVRPERHPSSPGPSVKCLIGGVCVGGQVEGGWILGSPPPFLQRQGRVCVQGDPDAQEGPRL